jgi:hypothetical protein
MSETGILTNFKIHNPLRFIIYVSTIIFIGSLFIPVKGYDLNLLQHKSLLIMILGVCFWFVMHFLEAMWARINPHHYLLNIVIVLYYVFYVISIICAVVVIAT